MSIIYILGKMLEHEIAYITGFALNMNINKANY